MRACIDIGGTKVAVSLAAPGEKPSLLHKRAEPTVKEGAPDALARQIIGMVEASCKEAGIAPADIEAVGVASCGPFVLRGGLVELAAPNICGGLAGKASELPNQWMTAPIEAPLRERFAKVRVENDCVASLEAERRWGALKGLDNCAYVTWSTGIGMGFCVDGRVLRGKNGNAGHGGHTFVVDDDDEALCGCGNRGDVESLIAGIAIGRRFGPQGWPDASALLDAARGGDAKAAVIVAGLTRVMGRALYNAVVLMDLKRISLGGSVFWHHRDYLLPQLQAFISEHFPALTKGVELVPAGLGDRVGDYAALALLE
jgi:glucokinase